MVEELLKHPKMTKKIVNSDNDDGMALHRACMNNDIKMVKLLLSYGADINAICRGNLVDNLDNNSKTALMACGLDGEHIECLKLILNDKNFNLKHLWYKDSISSPNALEVALGLQREETVKCIGQYLMDLFNVTVDNLHDLNQLIIQHVDTPQDQKYFDQVMKKHCNSVT